MQKLNTIMYKTDNKMHYLESFERLKLEELLLILFKYLTNIT